MPFAASVLMNWKGVWEGRTDEEVCTRTISKTPDMKYYVTVPWKEHIYIHIDIYPYIYIVNFA